MSSTPYAILGLLCIEPMTGYGVQRSLEESVSHFWSESYGQIYPALRRLEAAGLVRSTPSRTGARKGKVFAITPKGRKHFAWWLGEPPKVQPPRNELLLKLFFGRYAAPGTCAAHLRLLLQQQRELISRLQQTERQLRIGRRAHPDLRFWTATIGAGLSNARALLDWSEQALASL